MMRILLFCTIGFLTIFTILSVTDRGVDATPAAATPMNGLDFVDENRGWAVGNSGLIVHTGNGGDTWAVQPSGTTKDLYEVQFVDSSNGWAIGAAGTILHTSNGGTSWQAQDSPQAVDLHGLFLLDAQTGWIGYPDGVLVTINGGQTWRKTGVGIVFQARTIQFLNTSKGFVVSSDFDINDEVFTTTNGGETWTPVNFNFSRPRDVQFVNENFGVVIDLYSDIYLTHNGGANWQKVPWNGSTNILSALHFVDELHGWAVGENTLLRTENGGENWSKLTAGGNDVQFVSVTKGFIAANNGIKRTTDGGYNWSVIYISPDASLLTSTPTQIAVTPLNGLDFVDENRGWVVGNSGLIIHTANSGTEWKAQSSDVTNDLYEVDFVDANTGWIIGAGGTILHTTDGGGVWQPQDSLFAVDLHGLFFLDQQTGWIGFPDGILKTVNGGKTWRKTGTGVTFQVHSIQFVNANKGFLISSDLDINYALLTTTDGGESWMPVNLTSSRPRDLYFVNENFGAVLDIYGDIYLTHNGGANWEKIPWNGATIILSAIYFWDLTHGWAVGHEGSWPRNLLRTGNGGQNWSKLAGGGKEVHFVSADKGFIVDVDGVRRSLDGGYNWTTVYPTAGITPEPTTPTPPVTTTPVTITPTPPTCYALTRTHTGNGRDPEATPDHSTGCSSGQYVVGAAITLLASPDPAWQVTGWQGTQDNTSPLATNTLIMPAGAHTVTVNYGEAPATIAPLGLGCNSVTPVGEQQPGLCLSGLVYWNGQPVAGATVEIVNAQGKVVSVTTKTYNDAETRPHYRLNLSGPPLSLAIGDPIKLTAHYQNLTRTLEYVVQSGSQQVDLVLPAEPAAFTRPMATIMHIAAINLRAGDTLRVRGNGQDSDATPAIAAYRWFSDQQGELGTTATLEVSTQAYHAGVHHLSLTVQDTEGEWSDPVVTQIYITPAAQPSWTALLYLAGDYHDGEQLYRRFDRVLQTLRTNFTNPNVRIAVQLDGPVDGDTRRLLITSSNQITLTVGEKALDNPQELIDFVRWGQQELPAQHYYLAIANHGQAVRGIAWDTGSDQQDNGVLDNSAFLSVAEVASALADPSLAPIDVLHLDACSMNLVETGFELRKVANFLIASQYLGWDYFAYDQYLQKIQANTSPSVFARTVVEQYATLVRSDEHPYTIAALQLNRAEPVLNGINALATRLIALIENKTLATTTLDAIWQQSGKFESNGDYLNTNEDLYIDLDDWLKKLKAQVTDAALQAAADQLITELAPYELFILSSEVGSGALLPRYANGQVIDLSYANGLSIFYPKQRDTQAFDDYINDRLFTFTRYSQWPDFLTADRATLPIPTLTPPPAPLAPLAATRYLYLPVIRVK